MLGHITEWFYRHLVGIAPDPEQPGFGHIRIKPQPEQDLGWADAEYDSVRGPISVRWEREGEFLSLSVAIPANTTASVHLPVPEEQPVYVDGEVLADQAGVLNFERQGNRMVITIGSGTYNFATGRSR
jgi:hypothetical protein